jgi:hypothetical protein
MLPGKYAVILVYSTSYAIRAEKILFQADIQSKMMPVPRHLGSNCGVCLRIERADVGAAKKALNDAGVEIEGIHDLD